MAGKMKGGAEGRLCVELQKTLHRSDVLCLPALGSLDDIELDGLALFQAAKALVLNGGVMHEDILAILPADETVPFGVVEPLHCSLFHKWCVPSGLICADVKQRLVQAGDTLGKRYSLD